MKKLREIHSSVFMSFIGAQPRLLICQWLRLLSSPNSRNCMAHEPKVFAAWPFAGNVCQPRPYAAAPTSLGLSDTKCRKASPDF